VLRVERVHLPIFQTSSKSVMNVSLHFHPDKKNDDETKISGLRMVVNFNASQKKIHVAAAVQLTNASTCIEKFCCV
jgi:hypothetical protein